MRVILKMTERHINTYEYRPRTKEKKMPSPRNHCHRYYTELPLLLQEKNVLQQSLNLRKGTSTPLKRGEMFTTFDTKGDIWAE